ncbi:lysylphosphatidylglycerol synthase domain-containing protein [Psychroserpens sp. Hel_I_66]|uniref:lysylphosphatidylglycerol synthase domain-containing protein n=1 Tax=Psychroserpens sp. Hel_I_66 TaxID=1250004 RepID=UPI000645AD4B|nr:lysylphosphatidylglycerol synthase domain-containing protein [Psychroserpens sp. Hel_I_66]
MNFGGLPYKTKQFFFVLIKLSIVVGAFYFIYYKLTTNENLNFEDFIQNLNENRFFSIKTISFLVFLSIFNWFFEILKWKTLVKYIKLISFKNALEQSLASLTASLITPNRIGEYGAKAIYYDKASRKKIMLLNLVGNMTQMTVTVLFGCIGLFAMQTIYDLNISYFKFLNIVIIGCIVLGLVVLGLYRNRLKIKGFSVEKLKSFFKNLPLKIQFLAFAFSIARYLIFSFQFYVILTIFGVSLGYIDAMIVITSIYLLASVIPSIFIFDVVIKGSVAVYLFSIVGVGVNEFTILSCISIMWILNFVLPSMIGSYYVLNFKLQKTNT